MTTKLKWAETILLGAIACVFLVIGGFSLHVDILSFLWPFVIWTKRASTLRLVRTCYAGALAFLSLVSFISIRYRQTTLRAQCARLPYSVLKELRGLWTWLRGSLRNESPALWLAMITGIGLTVRGYFLAQAMRYDEAYTFLNFVNRGLFRIFYYPLPNNHVLHTILVRASIGIFGSHPVAIRLPAFLAGVFVVRRLLSFVD